MASRGSRQTLSSASGSGKGGSSARGRKTVRINKKSGKFATATTAKSESRTNKKSGNNSANKAMYNDDRGLALVQALNRERMVSDLEPEELAYRDPATLKWRIFEAAAGANGQRAFGVYWTALRDFMSGTLAHSELNDVVLNCLGEENIYLHNELILALLSNARCKHLPANLFSQVPAQCRGKVVHADIAKYTSSPANRSDKYTSFHGEGNTEAKQVSSFPVNGTKAPGSLKRRRAENDTSVYRNASPSSSAVSGSTASLSDSETTRSAASIDPRWVRVPPPPREPAGDRSIREDTGRTRLDVADIRGGKRITPGAAGIVKTELPGTVCLNGKCKIGMLGSSAGASSHDDEVKIKIEQDEREADLMMADIDRSFGTCSDVWDPWIVEGKFGGKDDTAEESSGKKRTASGSTGLECGPRSAKARKVVDDDRISRAGHVNVMSGGRKSTTPATPKQALERIFPAKQPNPTREGTDAAAYAYRSQRVPGARALAPFLQAMTAAQHMKVSHEVCRVMTVGVKEYLRRVIEACLENAKRENQSIDNNLKHMHHQPPSVKIETNVGRSPWNERSAVMQLGIGRSTPKTPQSSTGYTVGHDRLHGHARSESQGMRQQQYFPGPRGATPTNFSVGNGTNHPAGTNHAASTTPKGYARASKDQNEPTVTNEWVRISSLGSSELANESGPKANRVLAPGHLRAALETTPRLGGPPSSARAQWRRVAYTAGVGTMVADAKNPFPRELRGRHAL